MLPIMQEAMRVGQMDRTQQGLAARRWIGLATMVAVLLSPCTGQALPRVVDAVLVSADGLTLYTFDNDVPGSGKSVCNAPCSNIFPPYRVEPDGAASGDFGVVVRDDGTRQWAYKGRPLYTFFGDRKPGDKGGDGMNRNIWHVARP